MIEFEVPENMIPNNSESENQSCSETEYEAIIIRRAYSFDAFSSTYYGIPDLQGSQSQVKSSVTSYGFQSKPKVYDTTGCES